MDRRVNTLSIPRAMRAGAFALAVFCAGCANISDPAGYAIVAQDKYDFMSCKEIIGHHATQLTRLKQLNGYIEKADAAPGGFLVSGMAYRSELVSTRAAVSATERAARANKCEFPKP